MIARVGAFGRRACAVLAACSAVLHGFSLAHPTSVRATVLTLATALAAVEIVAAAAVLYHRTRAIRPT